MIHGSCTFTKANFSTFGIEFFSLQVSFLSYTHLSWSQEKIQYKFVTVKSGIKEVFSLCHA